MTISINRLGHIPAASSSGGQRPSTGNAIGHDMSESSRTGVPRTTLNALFAPINNPAFTGLVLTSGVPSDNTNGLG